VIQQNSNLVLVTRQDN